MKIELLLNIFILIFLSYYSVTSWHDKKKLKTEFIKIKFIKRNISKFDVRIFIFAIFLSRPFMKVLKNLFKILVNIIFSLNYKWTESTQEYINYTLAFFLNLGEYHKVFYDFFLNGTEFLTIFIGSISVIAALYIYVIGINDSFKKYVMTTIIREDLLLSLSVYIFFLLIIGVSPLFMIGMTLYLFYQLTKTIELVGKIENSIMFQENYSNYFLPKFREIVGTNKFQNLYFEIKKNLYKSVVENDLISTRQNIHFLTNTLREESDLENNRIANNETSEDMIESAQYISSIYEYLLDNPNDKIFNKVSYLHINYSELYHDLGNIDGFYYNLLNARLVYDYYLLKNNHERENFELNVVSGFRFGIISRIFSDLEKSSKETLEWIARYYRVLYILIERSILNKDRYFFKNFVVLIGYHLNERYYQDDKINIDYKKIKIIGYIGVRLLINSLDKKLPSYNSYQDKKYMDKLIHDSILYLSDNFDYNVGLTGLSIYDYLISDNLYDKLSWDSFFQPKINVIDNRFYTDETTTKIDEYFLEIFNKIISDENSKNKKCIELLKKYSYRFYSFGEEKISKEFLNLIQNTQTEEKKQKKITLRSTKVPLENIQLMKTAIETTLKESKLIKILKKLNIYEKNKEKCFHWMKNSYGINTLENKEPFLDSYIENLGKNYAQSLNNGIQKLFIKNILENAEEIKEYDLKKFITDLKLNKDYIIFTCRNYHEFIREVRKLDPQNIKTKTNLSEKYLKEFGNEVQASYKNAPIFNILGAEKGTYVIERKDIKSFIQIFPDDLKGNAMEVGYAIFSLKQSEEFYKGKLKRNLDKGDWLKDLSGDERKEKVKEIVYVQLLQNFKLKLNEGSTVYKLKI